MQEEADGSDNEDVDAVAGGMHAVGGGGGFGGGGGMGGGGGGFGWGNFGPGAQFQQGQQCQ